MSNLNGCYISKWVVELPTGEYTIKEICKISRISKTRVYQVMHKYEIKKTYKRINGELILYYLWDLELFKMEHTNHKFWLNDLKNGKYMMQDLLEISGRTRNTICSLMNKYAKNKQYMIKGNGRYAIYEWCQKHYSKIRGEK